MTNDDKAESSSRWKKEEDNKRTHTPKCRVGTSCPKVIVTNKRPTNEGGIWKNNAILGLLLTLLHFIEDIDIFLEYSDP